MNLPDNKYQCDMCGGIFDLQHNEDWNEEKAKQEKESNFGDSVPIEECSQICDKCYKMLEPEIEAYKSEMN